MFEITYRFTPGAHPEHHPRDAREAIAILAEGNNNFANLGAGGAHSDALVIDADFGFDPSTKEAPDQEPFGVVLGCADARVPIELVFGCSVNDLFVVRLAGNTIGSDAIGSIDYAVDHFASLRVAVVLGHTHCGAVTSAVDAFIRPGLFLDFAAALPLRTLLDRILTSVRASAKALEAVHGIGISASPNYRDALIDLSVGMNAAYTAFNMRAELAQQAGSRVEVVFGVYDLATRRVALPGSDSAPLGPPPQGPDDFLDFALRMASSKSVTELLAR